MKKILIVASSYVHIRAFLIPHIKQLVSDGWMVDVASENDGIDIPYVNRQIDIPVKRSPFHPSNISAIKKLSRYIDDEQYDIINCHTPIGAMIARMASFKARRKGAKVIYMAHGFHFYEGAPLINWLVYYTAEKLMARCTDAIITINEEDSTNARKFFPEIAHQYSLPGVGYDVNHIERPCDVDSDELRKKYHIGDDDYVCIYIARYTRNKNHRFLIKALAKLQHHIPQCKLLLLGDGEEMESCRRLAQELGVDDKVIFAGYQRNISAYLQLADVAVSPSLIEGLPIGLLEEMYVGLPILANTVRGHKDLIKNGETGMLYAYNDEVEFVEKFLYLYRNPEERKRLGMMAQKSIVKYSVENIIPQMIEIFERETSV